MKISALITGVKNPAIIVAEKRSETAPTSQPRKVDLIRSKKNSQVTNCKVATTVSRKMSSPKPRRPSGNVENSLCSWIPPE
jgi:hypothetical protein